MPAALYNHFLLAQDQHDRIEVVLVSPRNPLNIGAAARAMANFGFSRLTVVAPFAPHWREARSAIGAPELLHNAKETDSLADAVTDCTLVIGTGTLTHRKPEQCVVPLPVLAAPVEREMRRGGRVASSSARETRPHPCGPVALPSLRGDSDRRTSALDEPGPGRCGLFV